MSEKKTRPALEVAGRVLPKRKEFAMFNRPMLMKQSKHKKRVKASEFTVLMGIIFVLLVVLFVVAVARGDVKTSLFTGAFVFFSWQGLRWELNNNGR